MSNSNDPIKEDLEPNAKNILMSIIGQLTKGSDIQRISLPTFVLEPRSFLEKITDFMAHPRFLINAIDKAEPLQRFLGVLQYYLSGWHVQPPKGVKKPYNPVLGEYFRCWWDFENGTKGYYVSEQVSHHPPKSCYTFASPDNGFIIHGTMFPKSRFYGTSAGTVLEGTAVLRLLKHNNEKYIITYPNIYVYGVLFGQLVYDLGDQATITNEENGLSCKLEFKSKGFFGGSCNSVTGKVKNKETETLCELSGHWSDEIILKYKDGKTEQMLKVSQEEIHPKKCLKPEEQGEFESRKLWEELTLCINENRLDDATLAKNKVEEAQRERKKTTVYSPRYYKQKDGEDESGLEYEWGLGSFDENTVNNDVEDYIFGTNSN